MASSNGPSVPLGLSKLTVPQLKALCKERRITGYSKLGKAALLQRLAEVAVPTKTTTPANDQASPTIPPNITPTHVAPNPPAYIESSTVCQRNITLQPGQPATTDNTQGTETSTTNARLPTELPGSSQNPTATNATSISTRKASCTKRPAHIDISGPPKRSRTSLKPTPTAGHEPPVPRTTALQQKLPVDSSAFKVPEVPAARRKSLHGSASTIAKQLPGASKCSAVPRQITGDPGRFKPLVVSKPKLTEPDQMNEEPLPPPATSASVIRRDSALFPHFHTKPLPVLGNISFPPKASERKWVYRWALVLSALSPTDRQTCTLVSRTFRYAGRNYPSKLMLLRHVGILRSDRL